METFPVFGPDDERIVDKKTGEVLTVHKDVTVPATGDNFFLVFLQNLGSLYKLKNAKEIHVLAKLCSMTVMNTGTVSLTTGRRKEISDELNMTQQNLSNILGKLKKNGLISGNDGEFTINPELMWKGSTLARQKWMNGQGMSMMIQFKTAINEQ